MTQQQIKRRIRSLAEGILRENPQGVRFTDLKKQIYARDNSLNQNTIVGTITDLHLTTKGIEKPSRGLYRIAPPEDRSDADSDAGILSVSAKSEGKPKEEDFYVPFAEWLTNDVEDATKAIPLGGANKFRGKWGTPDVIGKRVSKPSDIIQQPVEIISAEIKTETSQLITAFGQAVAYCLFSHRSYLVVPQQASDDDLSRLDSLCQTFGLGLVLFDAMKPQDPSFKIRTRPRRQEPDYFYMNENMKNIESTLFA
ncbi:MAG: hypothetical protein OXJ63_00130 [Gammaproteobacteria bacterium]|nr:hypothetical protein [Gammaproteobacteria bacterium]